MELLIIAILLFGGYSATAPLRRYDRRKKIGPIHGPYGWKQSRKKRRKDGGRRPFGTVADQNADRAAYWKKKYHEAIRQRDEAAQAALDAQRKLRELAKEFNSISKQIHGDREIMKCTHPHCQRAKAIMMNMVSKAKGMPAVRKVA